MPSGGIRKTLAIFRIDKSHSFLAKSESRLDGLGDAPSVFFADFDPVLND
jgi:hypothetical protein